MLGFISPSFTVDVQRHLYCQEKEESPPQTQITFGYMDIQNTLEVAVSWSCLFLSIDYCRVGWEIVQMKTLQISAVWQEESHSACGWITHHVPMKESFKYRTIQKALFQRCFMVEYDFGFLTLSLHWIGQQSERGQESTSEESDPWYEKRTSWQDTECLIFMNCFFSPFYLNRDFLVTCSDGILNASGKPVQLPLQLAKDLATLQVSYFLTDKLFLNNTA